MIAVYGLPMLVGLLVAAQVYFRIRANVTLSFDSWVYWESALSLAAGNGYTTSTGQAVMAWPPLFPFVLAVWDRLFVLDMAGVRHVLLILSSTAGIFWSIAWQRHCKGIKPFAALSGQIFIILYLPIWYDGLLSEALWMPLLGWLFLLFGSQDLRWGKLAAITVVIGLCLLCRNQSVALVPALLVYVATRWGIKSIVAYLAPFAISLLAWVLVRYALQQSSSHELGLGFSGLGHSFSELVGFSGNLLAVSTAYLSIISLVFVTILLMAISAKKLRLIGQTSPTESNGFAWVFFAVTLWVCTAVVAIIAGVPIHQPRFYLFSAFSLVLGSAMIVAEGHGRVITLTAASIFLLASLSSGFRAYYFAQHRDQLNSAYESTFKPDRQWVNEVIRSVDRAIQEGRNIEDVTGQYGISSNTYRRWKSLPLYTQNKFQPKSIEP